MDLIQAIILGVVEGVTEFLPVSSTFHLIFTSKILGISQSDFIKLFEVFIQSGAILSVLILYFRDLWHDRELGKKVLVSFIPTALVGLVLYKVIKNIFFEADLLMLVVFGGLGLIFIGFEYLIKKGKLSLKQSVKSLTYKDALIIGLVQSIAVIPGVSRAGVVILGMMILQYRRDEAARYSFLLAIPTIFAASALDLVKMRNELFASSNNFMMLIVGSLTAFVTSYFVIKWLVGYLKRNTLISFGFYRLILAIILVIIAL